MFDVARTLNEFENLYNQSAEPFEWNFTRQDLTNLLDRRNDRTAQDPPLPFAA